MKCAFSEQITKSLPNPLPELLQIVTLTQASVYIIKGQAAPAELSTDVAFGSRCRSFAILLLYLLSLLPQYLSLTNNMQCIGTAQYIHTGCWKDAGWHIIQGVQLPCRRHQRAFWLLCKGTSQNSLGPCCPHTCHRSREVLRPYLAHAFDWTLVRVLHLLDAFCWTCHHLVVPEYHAHAFVHLACLCPFLSPSHAVCLAV